MKLINFLKVLFKDRYVVDALMDTGNSRFLKFSLPGHFYSPIPDMVNIHSNSGKIFRADKKPLAGIDLNEKAQLNLLNSLADYYSEIPFEKEKAEGLRYYFDNSYFSFGDGVVLYSMLRHLSPTRIVEIGSGFSSALMLDVNERFFNQAMSLTFVEPFPERLNSLISDSDKDTVSILEKPVQNIDISVFQSLRENDILFIDSSHVAKTDSDVLHLFFEILPLLHRGVIIHIHDVLWPFEYPEIWLKSGRAWNEAYFLRAFLQFNDAFEILYFNHYLALHHRSEVEKNLPLALVTPSARKSPGNASIWLKKVG